ncbi:MAG: GNAT family N-acetyltransferase, partial [Candidatus Aminicenantes bacterium]|nr:GNAT family N-acetyltransferase [Candidatus Aminicenantes bacterium]
MIQKTGTLKDGREITLRPLETNDLENLMKFYKALPFEDRKYLKVDVTKDEVVKKRLQAVIEEKAVRLIALHHDDIIAEGEIFFIDDDWHKNQGEIRIIVARDFQRKGLGSLMMRELYLQALDHKVELLVGKMMLPQANLQNILKRFGFKEGHILPHYALDQDHQRQDMLIMTCDIKDFYTETDAALKDGTQVMLRLLQVNENDLEKLMKFYQALPYEDRKYLKVDVTKKDIVEKRLNAVLEQRSVRVIALHNAEIIAEGELFLREDDWFRAEGEIRIIVARNFQRKGLGMLLMREIYYLALKHKIDHLVAKMMTPQVAFQEILKKFRFKEEHILPKYALDQENKKQDMMIMICDVKDFWR